MSTLDISAIIPAYNRPESTLRTIQRIEDCHPSPAEIIVHVDGNNLELRNQISIRFPQVGLILSEQNIGPGGARNKLLSRATYSLVASFDDDSFPLENDYFKKLHQTAEEHPDAAVIAADVFERHSIISPPDAEPSKKWVADYSGGGCAYQKHLLSDIGDYVSLPVAYGMEETDFALRLHSRGRKILHTSSLRVFHDSDLHHHSAPEIAGQKSREYRLTSFSKISHLSTSPRRPAVCS